SDGDGDLDLTVATLEGLVHLQNDGAGRFTEETAARGLAVDGWTSVLAPLDVDDDGDLDLFVGRYVVWSGARDDELDCRPDGVRRDYCSPNLFPATTPALLINDGGRFHDASARAGLPIDETKALGVLTVDLDGDHRLDLIVANDQVRTQVFLAPGDGTLREVATELGLVGTEGGAAYAGMGIDGSWHAAPGEGFCLGIGNFFGEPVTLHCRADRRRPFLSRAGRLGIREPTLPWVTFGLKWFDADLDGDDDLVLANGNVSDEERVAGIPYRQPIQVLESDGARLRDVSAEALGELATRRLLGRGLAVTDLDDDGDLDVLVVENDGPLLALENRSEPRGAWLGVRLRGAGPNTQAIGAEMTLETGKTTLRSWAHATSSYYGQSTATRVFGLGDADGPTTLAIRWPSGRVQRVEGLAPGQVHVIEEDAALPVAAAADAVALAPSPRAAAAEALRAGQQARAIDLYKEAIAQEPDDPTLRRELASATLAAGDEAGARAAARAAAERCGDSYCLLRHVLKVLDARGQHEYARTAVERGLEVIAAPSAGLWNYAGAAREAAGDRAGAERAYRAALAALPTSTYAASNLAMLLVERGAAAEALAIVEPLARDGATSGQVLRALGTARYTLGDLDGAREAFAASVARDPDDGLSRYNLGQIAAERGELDEAVDQLRRASVLRPDDYRVWGNLGATLASQGDVAGARAAFRRVLELQPGDPIAQRMLASLPGE
ncbi:MAG: tetratricopeptide repeat protein, partial [Myxococcales bacterium]|nr:tetratricopeptide repeat protein [Myxococcales bacterium]